MADRGRSGSDTAPLPPSLHIHPPLLNSANPWATTQDDLKRLFECPSTGAVTTRTALLDGFPHDPGVHRYAFFDPVAHGSSGGPFSVPGWEGKGEGEEEGLKGKGEGLGWEEESASLNTLGYSPIPLGAYLGFIKEIASSSSSSSSPSSATPAAGDEVGAEKGKGKLFILSVTGSSPAEVARCYAAVAALQPHVRAPLAVEVNLSCPNIPGKPPPAYDGEALAAYLRALGDAAERPRIPWGVKTPPYTHAGQFDMFVDALLSASTERAGVCPLSFVTATNTLGACLLLEPDSVGGGGFASKLGVGGSGGGGGGGGGIGGIGGMAGPPLHPLALGNVKTLRARLDEHPETRHVQIIGVGGVGDAHGYRRMRAVGAAASIGIHSGTIKKNSFSSFILPQTNRNPQYPPPKAQPANPLDYDYTTTNNRGGNSQEEEEEDDDDYEALSTATATTTTAYEPSRGSSFTAVESLPPGPWTSRCRRVRASARRFFASRAKHALVLALVVLDVAGILADIFVALVTCELGREKEAWVAPTRAALAHFALAMSCVFVLELVGELFAEGFGFFSSWFHCFDAFVIVVSFAVDLLEHGVVEEIASLIVVFRLWRFVKIIQEFSVEASEQTEELHKRIEDLEAQKAALEAQLAQR
ncbi:hypothetical protein F4810DRAFT_706595 [Camillea tinctor]|nr:hypothetical protein F4810DRAFT_706595 [Camillea tinctor]